MNSLKHSHTALADLTLREVSQLVTEQRSRLVRFQDNSRQVVVVGFDVQLVSRVLHDLQREFAAPSPKDDCEPESLHAAELLISVADLLAEKGSEVHTIDRRAVLRDAARQMCEQRVGALVICDGQHASGIMSERDLMRAVSNGRNLERTRVEQVMTSSLITSAPQDQINVVMQRMTMHRVRHMPIVEDDRLVGLISIGDVVKRLMHGLAVENDQLVRYVRGEAAVSVP